MPPVAVAFVGAVVSSIGGAIAAGTVVGLASLGAFVTSAAFLIPVGLSVGAALLQTALTPKPKSEAPAAPPNRELIRTFRQSAAPRRRIYGRRRVGGVMVFADVTDVVDDRHKVKKEVTPSNHPAQDDGYLHLGVAFASQEVDEIEAIYFGDQVAWTASGGYQSPFKDRLLITLKKGEDDQEAIQGMVDASGRQPGSGRSALSAPASVSTSVVDRTAADGTPVESLKIDFDAVTGATEYQVEWRTIDGKWSSRRLNTSVSVYTEDFPVETQGLIEARVTAFDGDRWTRYRTDGGDLQAATGAWTEFHRLRGICYAYFILEFDRDVYPTGIPNISAVIRGAKVHDPRTGTTAWSANPALCILDYLKDDELGLGVSDAEVDEASFIAAANLCDEAVNIAAGGTEKRYELHGVVQASATPESSLEAMLTTMGAGLSYSGGMFGLVGAAFEPATLTLTEDDFLGPIEIQGKRSATETINAVRGVFPAASINYQEDDFPSIKSSAFAEQDGRTIWADLNLDMTTSSSMCQRLAKIALLRSRQQITCNVPAKLRAATLQPGSTVNLTIDRYGWSEKTFEVIEWSFQISDGALACVLSLREIDAAIFNWTTDEEELFSAGAPTMLSDRQTLRPPGPPEIATAAIQLVGGEVVEALSIAWEVTAGNYGGHYEVEYTYDLIEISSQTTTQTSIVRGGIAASRVVGARVRAVTPAGRTSAWSYSDITTGPAERVPKPTGVTVSTSYDPSTKRTQAAFSWTDPGNVPTWVVDVQEPDTAWRRVGGFASASASAALYTAEISGHKVRIAAALEEFDMSPWTVVEFSVQGGALLPPDVTGFTIQASDTQAALRWDDAGPTVSHFRIRQTPDAETPSWGSSADIATTVVGTSITLPAILGSYLIKAVSVYGEESANAVSVSSTSIGLASLNVVETLTAEPAWSGTLTNARVEGGVLLQGAAAPDVAAPGIWESGEIDLGEDFPVRISLALDAGAIELANTVDTWTRLSDVARVGGADAGDWDLKTEIRVRADGGSYGPWTQGVVGDHVGRYFQLKATLTTYSAGIQPRIASLKASLDMPDRVEGDADVTCPAGGLQVLFAPAFRNRPAISVDGQSLASGDRKVVSNQNATGFQVQFFDSGGTPKEVVIDWIAKGYGRKA